MWHNNLFSVFLLVLFFYIARDIMGGILRFNVLGGWRVCLGETERGGICKIDLIFFLIWGKKRKITVQFTTRGFATL